MLGTQRVNIPSKAVTFIKIVNPLVLLLKGSYGLVVTLCLKEDFDGFEERFELQTITILMNTVKRT